MCPFRKLIARVSFMMTFIDIHTHKENSEPGVITVQNIYPGEGFGAFRGNNYYSVGLHPWHIKSGQENNRMLETVEKSCKFDHVIFIGECGLDKQCGMDFKEQERVFLQQVELAEKMGKPVIIHCVKAYEEILAVRKKLNVKTPWIIHGFTGNTQQAGQLAKHGFLFSFGKALFNEGSKAAEAFRRLPENLIFLETDELPEPVKEIYKKASEIRGTGISLLAKSIESNFNRLLGKNELVKPD